MARKGKSSSRRNKIEPSMMTLSLVLPSVGPGASVYSHLDLSQICSLVNRRFYRQGLNWAVAGFKFFTAAGFQGQIQVHKLPNTWVMSNAWEKSMRAWMKLNREALEESGSVRPRFLDFKIFANQRHHLAGVGANLLPISSDGNYTAGEWEASKMVIPIGAASPGASASRELIAVGQNYPGFGASGLDAVSLIEGYAASRGLPDILDPNAPHDAADVTGFNPDNWLGATFNEGTSQTEVVLDDMITENNQAPYPFENDGVHLDTMYPGGGIQGIGLEIHDTVTITSTTIGGVSRVKGGNFPCGLIEFQTLNSGETTAVAVQIDLIPGTHRGYLAETMVDM
ncbi:MAG: hypothetical protein [Circular genetic element sp.]|nr:MAG: hypothetical protein [Circular genetic element sp.]